MIGTVQKIVMFDVDGTLTPARKDMKQNMIDCLAKLGAVPDLHIGVVGGSDHSKIIEQLGHGAEHKFKYFFSENGLTGFRDGQPLPTTSIKAQYGDAKLNTFINFVLTYIAGLDIPIKRGTFIEFRNGMINVSPIGRNCSYDERVEFEKYDVVHNVRSTMVKALQEKFADYGFTYSIGGMISFDVFPTGWDKTFCLTQLLDDGYKTIHFFGDKTYKGGNDYEIFSDERTIGHTVTSPEDCIVKLTELFLQ
ncbi:phosphomannomutase [Sphaeroforma arctica JP610]|uniref:Phosphomannomutase n=1 Tax=Sphaeroforma arctica JP610 TaxID=667725 RepID=A0A0L0G762_9EUKA|nr:phosphomannomutase [Sphaeroforma arctica JP610]KNC84058.1 phosphomannomutase [Sphaeroforma arctica JP610]|eukprot:XP_014157960.1 phosphomannomutase [Sphaeroforma arctica JP610]